MVTNWVKIIRFTNISKNSTLKSDCLNLIGRLNNAMEYQDTEMAKTKYLNTEDLTPLLNEESLSLLQANFSSSLCCPEELHSLFNENKIEIIGITESRIRHTSKPLDNVILPGENIEQTSTKTFNGVGGGGWGVGDGGS